MLNSAICPKTLAVKNTLHFRTTNNCYNYETATGKFIPKVLQLLVPTAAFSQLHHVNDKIQSIEAISSLFSLYPTRKRTGEIQWFRKATVSMTKLIAKSILQNVSPKE